MLLILLISAIVYAAKAHAGQQSVLSEGQPDWQKYIRSPRSEIVKPRSVIADRTVGNVTNLDGFLMGKGVTLLTGTNTSVAPEIVVDWGQNIAGFVSIHFGGASNTTVGFPGIRLAFSETLGYLGNTSDFSRSYNVSNPGLYLGVLLISSEGDSITPGSDQVGIRSLCSERSPDSQD